MRMDQPILELRSITKKYPGVVALDDVSLSFYRGEVHAIVGGERRRQVYVYQGDHRRHPAHQGRDMVRGQKA